MGKIQKAAAVVVVEAPRAGDLAVMDNLPASKFDDKMFEKVGAGGKYLPRLMLYGANSDPVMTEKTEIGYSLVEGKDTFTFLGREVDLYNIAWRPKALEFGDSVVSIHNPDNPEFKRIKDRSDNEKNSGCMYGPEFLVYIPALGKFATFLMGSATARNESSKMKATLRGKATLKTKLYSNKDFKWYGPEVLACSSPLEPPDGTDLLEKVTEFQNPKETEIEAVEPATVGANRDR